MRAQRTAEGTVLMRSEGERMKGLRKRWADQRNSDYKDLRDEAFSGQMGAEEKSTLIQRCEAFLMKYNKCDTIESFLIATDVYFMLGSAQGNLGCYKEGNFNLEEGCKVARTGQVIARQSPNPKMEEVWSLYDKEVRALLQLADHHHEEDNDEEAMKLLLKALGRARLLDALRVAECLLWIAKIYKVQGKITQAESKVRDAMQKMTGYHSTLEARNEMGKGIYLQCFSRLQELLRLQGRIDEAEKLADEAHEKAKELGYTDKYEIVNQVNLKDVKKMLERAEWDDADVALQKWLQSTISIQGPESFMLGEGLWMLGVCHGKQGRPVEAEAAFSQAEACFRNHPSPILRKEKLCHVKEAKALYFYSDIDPAAARTCLEYSLNTWLEMGASANAALMQFNLGNLLYKNGEWEEAAAYFKQSLEERKDATACCRMAQCLYRLGRNAEAVTAFRAGEALQPGIAIQEGLMLLPKLESMDQPTMEFDLFEFDTMGEQRERSPERPQQAAARERNIRANQRMQAGYMDDGRALMALGEEHLGKKKHAEARIAFSRAMNRFQACGAGAAPGSQTPLLQLLMATCFCRRAEAWVGRRDGDLVAHLAAAKADCMAAGELMRARKEANAGRRKQNKWRDKKAAAGASSAEEATAAAGAVTTSVTTWSGSGAKSGKAEAGAAPEEQEQEQEQEQEKLWEQLGVRQEVLVEHLTALASEAERQGSQKNKGTSKKKGKAKGGPSIMMQCVNGGTAAREQGGLNDDECPTCLTDWAEIQGPVVLLACQHMVCGPCMLAWAQGRQEGFAADDMHHAISTLPTTCPCCRAAVEGGLRAVTALVAAPPHPKPKPA